MAFRRHLACIRRQDGFTLIEMLIAIAILAIVLMAFAQLVTSDLNTSVQDNVRDAQRATWTSSDTWLEQHLLAAQRPYGMLCPSGTPTPPAGCPANASTQTIDPLSIAGDQLVFENADGSTCYRVFYLRASKQVMAASASACSAIAPTRGPSDPAASDPVLDSATLSSVSANDTTQCYPNFSSPQFCIADLANDIAPTTSSASPLQLLSAYGDDGSALAIDPRASLTATHSSFYSDPANASEITSFTFTEYVAPPSGSLGSTLSYQQNIAAAQTSPGSDPVVQARVDGTNASGSPWTTITAASGPTDVYSDGSSAWLKSSEIASQEGWLTFDGALQVECSSACSASSPGGDPSVEVELYRDGNPAGTGTWTADLEPVTTLTFPASPPTSATEPQSIPLQGSFSIPADSQDAADAGSDTYSLRVLINNTSPSGGPSFSYSSAPGGMWLDYRLVAR